MQKKFLLSLLVVFSATIATSVSAQNRSKFYYVLKQEKVLQPPQNFIDTMRMIATRGRNNLPEYVFTETEKIKKVRLVYRNTKDNTTKDMYLCSKDIRCNINLVNGVPVLDVWQIKYKTLRDRPDHSDCVDAGTKLGTYRFELDLSRDSVGSPTKSFTMPFRARTWGVGTVPFRVRFPQDSVPATVSASIGFIANYGFTFGLAKITSRSIVHYSFTVGPFVGLSSADLKKETVKDPKQLKGNQMNVAFSYGINTVFARNNIGFVLSCGFDSNVGKNAKLWIYQHKPWLGFGLNVSLGYF